MNNIFTLFFIISISLVTACSTTKEHTASSNRAIKLYQKANALHQQYQYKDALETLYKAIDLDSGFIEAYLVIGDIQSSGRRHKKAVWAYKQAINRNPDFFPNAFYHLASQEYMIGQYDSAAFHLERFIRRQDIKPHMKMKAQQQLKKVRFAQQAVANPVPYNPVNLGDSINSVYDEYWPRLSADEQTMIFTRRIPIDKTDTAEFKNRQEDFFIAHKQNATWEKAKNMNAPLNSSDNEGAHTISVNGSYIFFTACNRHDGYGLCDIYYSANLGGRWKRPVNTGRNINSNYSEKQPTLSPDGTTLYFISDRKGGFGGYDIWKSVILPNGSFSAPENLGNTINTSGDETSPFIHFDNKTLYFASNLHLGMGGYDIFVSQQQEDGEWSTPENLGYPINSWHDEEGLFVNARGDMAYYSSDREITGRDIYKFNLYKDIRPDPVSYVKGTVYDAKTNQPLSAYCELIELNNAETVMESASDPEKGEFLVTLPAGNNYALNVSKKGYLFHSEHFELKKADTGNTPFHLNIPLKPIQKGQSIVLRNIFYEVDSYELKKESIAELNKVILFLENNPQVNIQINGHTDSTASKEYNLQLSEQRAKEVVNYLIQNGISDKRLSYEGYGERKPVADNATEQGRAKNRRTEMMVVSSED
jgi:outer membrane protein OmpA-like peptidoglycan-associated protein